VKATLRSCQASPRTDPPPCYQLFDLLKETGRVGKGIFYLSMNGEVSEPIHDDISSQKGQDRFEELQTVSPIPVKGNWLNDAQEIKNDGEIAQTM